MPLTESQRRAQQKYYEKNRERLAAYKSKYWQLNKHKWSRNCKSEQDEEKKSETTEPESA
jgi:hypothetical protein